MPASSKSLTIALLGLTTASALAYYIQKKIRGKNYCDDETSKALNPAFHKASEIAKTFIDKLSQDDQLMIYGLYKQATMGNATNPPSRLNVVAYAKYNAWTKFQGIPKDFAMLKYVEIVNHFMMLTKGGGIGTKAEDGLGTIAEEEGGGGTNTANAMMFNGQDDNDDIVYEDDDDETEGDLSLSDDDDLDDKSKNRNVINLASSTFGMTTKQSTLSYDDAFDSKNSNTLTPLILQAATKGDLDALQKCIDENENLNETDDNGQTALHLAADHGNSEAVSILIKSGANPNASDISGISVLEAAVISGHSEVVKILLDAGANPDQEDMDGETPRSCAEDDDHEEVKRLLRNAPKQSSK
mmetsp:Transcript_8807/g.10194  ORF Transcript_8807/g.10194 Transcript_8807/m.10194 type:complete len:356 (+) Transcript_8807:99-1166(+)